MFPINWFKIFEINGTAGDHFTDTTTCINEGKFALDRLLIRRGVLVGGQHSRGMDHEQGSICGEKGLMSNERLLTRRLGDLPHFIGRSFRLCDVKASGGRRGYGHNGFFAVFYGSQGSSPQAPCGTPQPRSYDKQAAGEYSQPPCIRRHQLFGGLRLESFLEAPLVSFR